MSWGYMFFRPTRLPLTPADLSEETVGNFTDVEEVRATLGAHLPGIAWSAEPAPWLFSGRMEVDGASYDLTALRYEPPAREEAPTGAAAAPQLIVKMSCSGRVDSAPVAQRLCDAAGWIAFDDRAYLFQPHRPPVPGGGG